VPRDLLVLAGYPGSGKTYLLEHSYAANISLWPNSGYKQSSYKSQFDDNIFTMFKATNMEGRDLGQPWFNQNHLTYLAFCENFRKCRSIIMEVDLSAAYEYDYVMLRYQEESRPQVPRGPIGSSQLGSTKQYFDWLLNTKAIQAFDHIYITTLVASFSTASKQYKSRWVEKGYSHAYADHAYTYYLKESRACRMTHAALLNGWLYASLDATKVTANVVTRDTTQENPNYNIQSLNMQNLNTYLIDAKVNRIL
jgi:hypothetical protein